jgi:hypothetical protein
MATEPIISNRMFNEVFFRKNVVSSRENGANLLDQGTIGVWLKRFAQKPQQIVLVSVKRLMRLVSNYFHQHPFSSSPVEFPVENLFPWSKIKLAFGNRDDDFPAYDLPLEMGVGVVFDRRWWARAAPVFPATVHNRDEAPVRRR